MLWACLRFPQLALDAVRVDADARARSLPFAVVEGPVQRRQIAFANAAARTAGVRAGQPLATARMLCPRLSSAPREPDAERQALESLAGGAYRFSADVAVVAPDTIFVEVGASLALFDGWPALQRRLRAELDRFGFAYSLAAAPTASGARVLAAHADGSAVAAPAPLEEALGNVPLAASGFDTRIVTALQGMGLRNLRDLFHLPRAELARRIGTQALDALDRMRGSVGETLPRWHPAERFERRIEFSLGIESHGALAFPLQRLIREFALFLVARDGGAQRFTLILGHERGASTRIEIGLLAPQRDAASLLELARARLDRIDLVAPAHALTLSAHDLPPLAPLHRDLFDEHRRERLDWPALAERLRARLGDAALRGLACVADHRPGRAWRFVATSGDTAGATSRPPAAKGNAATKTLPDSTAAPSATRPFWLLRDPVALRSVPVRILAGPERIENGWWDGHDYRRDYYIVETRPGQLAWAYVEAGTLANWTLHGWFA